MKCPGVFRGGIGQGWPAAGLGAVSVTVHSWDLLKEVSIIFITSTIVEISLEYSLEGLMLKLKLQYFGHLMGRTDSLEKTLTLG